MGLVTEIGGHVLIFFLGGLICRDLVSQVLTHHFYLDLAHVRL